MTKDECKSRLPFLAEKAGVTYMLGLDVDTLSFAFTGRPRLSECARYKMLGGLLILHSLFCNLGMQV